MRVMFKHELVKLDLPLPIRVLQFNYNRDETNLKVDLHWHKSIEIILPKKGDLNYIINGNNECLKAGNVLIINSNEIHRTEWTRETERYEGYCVQIDYDYFKKYYSNLGKIRFSNTLDKNANNQIKSIIKGIVLTAQDKGKNYELLVASHLLTLLYHLLDYATDEHGELIKNMKYKEKNKKMTEILAYIHTNYNSDIGASSVATHFNMSQGHLTRLFKEYVGIPPKHYIDEFRLDRAAEQIIYTDDAIVDIAFLNGFSNINSFYKMFNKKFGMAPNSYRKDYRETKED